MVAPRSSPHAATGISMLCATVGGSGVRYEPGQRQWWWWHPVFRRMPGRASRYCAAVGKSGGTDNDEGEENGRTPFSTACDKGHVNVARLLVEAGADITKAMDVLGTPRSSSHVPRAMLMLCSCWRKRGWCKHKGRDERGVPRSSLHAMVDTTSMLCGCWWKLRAM